MRLSDTNIASLIQLLIVLLMIFSLVDYFVTGLISQFSHSSFTEGLFFNYYLFSTNGVSKLFNFTSLPIWGIFQFFIYCLVIILVLQLWKVFRSENDSNVKALKFNAIFSFFIIILSSIGALTLAYTGLAANGLYTMNILYVRIVIVFLLITIFFSLLTIVRALSTK